MRSRCGGHAAAPVEQGWCPPGDTAHERLDVRAKRTILGGMNEQRLPDATILPRARKVAVGLADVGLSGAEELLRRMSPEGREQARRERAARARRQRRLLLWLTLATAASLLVWALLVAVVSPGAALAIAAALLLLACVVLFLRADPRTPGREALVQATLPDLAGEAQVWLAAQDRGLPPPARQLAGDIRQRLDDLAPHVVRIDPRSPAAAALRKLIAHELPDLIGEWRGVAVSARRLPLADGRSADDHLINGLRLIEGELAQVHGDACDGLRGIAVQGRYLELKYRRDDLLS